MSVHHKQLLRTLLKANSKGQLPEALTSLSSTIKGQSSSLLRMWNIYLCRYIRTKEQAKAKQILEIMQKILHYYSLLGEVSDPYIPVLISNNGASISQSEWNFVEAESHLEAMLEYIENCIDKILEVEEPEFVRAAEVKRLEIKVRLQLAGVYSQLQKHQKAIIMADSSIRLIYQFCINIRINLENDPSLGPKACKARERIEEIIASSEPEKVVENAGLEKIRQQLCAWKQNSDLSSLHLKKLIENKKTRRSSLSSFQIGDIMEVAPMMSYQLPSEQIMQDLLGVQQLEQLTIQLSVGYFTLGTQLYYQKSKKNKKNVIDKYKDIFQNQFKKEQLFHLQALTLGVNTIGFQTAYIQHLIKVFNDNYNGLQIIEETLKEESNSSIRVDDIRSEQTPIKLLVSNRRSQQEEKEKGAMNDSLFDVSVDNKGRRRESSKNTRNLTAVIKDIGK